QDEWKKKTAAVEAELKALKAKRKTVSETADLDREIARKEAELPPPLPVLQTVEDDVAKFLPVHVLARGDSERPGDAVGMRPIGVLLADDAQEWGDRMAAPRLALAKWIAAADNPLTARVMVNRIWQHHFGAGLV